MIRTLFQDQLIGWIFEVEGANMIRTLFQDQLIGWIFEVEGANMIRTLFQEKFIGWIFEVEGAIGQSNYGLTLNKLQHKLFHLY